VFIVSLTQKTVKSLLQVELTTQLLFGQVQEKVFWNTIIMIKF